MRNRWPGERRGGGKQPAREEEEEEQPAGEVKVTSTWAGLGLAPEERSIWAFNPGQAKGERMASPSQALARLQATKQAKIGSREPG